MNPAIKPETPEQLEPLIENQLLIECRCGEVMLHREYRAHWVSCRSPGEAPIPLSREAKHKRFMDFVRYFYGRNQFIPDSCIP